MYLQWFYIILPFLSTNARKLHKILKKKALAGA